MKTIVARFIGWTCFGVAMMSCYICAVLHLTEQLGALEAFLYICLIGVTFTIWASHKDYC